MLAIIRHALFDDTNLDLQLVRYGKQYGWAELSSGRRHGVLYNSPQAAVDGLRRFYLHPYKVVVRSDASCAA